MPSFAHLFAVFAFVAVAAPAASAAEMPDFLTANVDASMNPGDDLYQYANGTWIKRHPIPASEARWGVAQLVREWREPGDRSSVW